jgi:hypothetical protein
MDMVLGDLSAALTGVVSGSGTVLLAVMAVAVIANGMMMDGVDEVFGRAAQALLIVVVLFFLAQGLMDVGRFTLKGWADNSSESWRGLMDLTVLRLIGYYLVAFVGVLAVYGIKRVVRR